MRSWSPYFDQLSLITQENGDGGDCIQREALFAIAEGLNVNCPAREESWLIRLSRFDISPGIFVRYPPRPGLPMDPFWIDPAELSRDQTIPLLVAMTLRRSFWALDRFWAKHWRRFFKCQNRDFLGPAIFIRAYRWYWLWPLLCILDLALVWNSLNRIGLVPRIQETTGKWVWLDAQDVGDDINHVVTLLFSRFRLRTPISYLARVLYRKFRPFGGPQAAWDFDYRESSGAPPMNELWEPIIQKWIMA